ncbi:TPA: serine/threonine protein kinase [Clostridium botulinum]|nr:serine/threonine protein kinase [Clostridium botulinum]
MICLKEIKKDTLTKILILQKELSTLSVKKLALIKTDKKSFKNCISIGSEGLVFLIDGLIVKYFPQEGSYKINKSYYSNGEIAIYQLMKYPLFMPQVYGYDKDFIIMEYIQGETLFDVFNKIFFCLEDNAYALDLRSKLIGIMEHFIANKILPYDLFLDDVYIMPDGQLKLIDFGKYLTNYDYIETSGYTPKEIATEYVDTIISNEDSGYTKAYGLEVSLSSEIV